ncbi:MAG: hypothetical protein JKY18_12365 [Flavobacteriales bacterium]|nr:hypothetical protein [Flavobacteriales bacterium]MBL4736106.1 hypothetical protein [Flavobacteriales bacterium]PCH88254.1 MAG: hypothetical protein COB88_04290 [Flavobacteriales bacterium]
MFIGFTILYVINHLIISLVRAFARQKEIFFMSGYYSPLINCLKKRSFTQLTFSYALLMLCAEVMLVWAMG